MAAIRFGGKNDFPVRAKRSGKTGVTYDEKIHLAFLPVLLLTHMFSSCLLQSKYDDN